MSKDQTKSAQDQKPNKEQSKQRIITPKSWGFLSFRFKTFTFFYTFHKLLQLSIQFTTFYTPSATLIDLFTHTGITKSHRKGLHYTYMHVLLLSILMLVNNGKDHTLTLHLTAKSPQICKHISKVKGTLSLFIRACCLLPKKKFQISFWSTVLAFLCINYNSRI